MGWCCQKRETDFEPVKPRGCTDILCLLLFLIFIAVLVFVAAFAFVLGNPKRLIYGTDSFGNICGMKNEPLGSLSFSGLDLTDRPYLFYHNLNDPTRSLKICVRKCPPIYLQNEVDRTHYEQETGNFLCGYDMDPKLSTSTLYPQSANDSIFRKQEEKLGLGPCPVLPYLPTKPFLKRCIPESFQSALKILPGLDIFSRSVSDLYDALQEILVMIAVAVLLSLLAVVLLHFVAAIVSWIIMVVVALASLGVTGVLWWTYIELHGNANITIDATLLPNESWRNEKAFLSYSIVATVVTVILLLLILVMRSRVALVVDLFKEAGHCIRSMPCLLLQPFWTFAVLLAFLAFWTAMLLGMATAVYPTDTDGKHPLLANETNPSNPGWSLVKFDSAPWVHNMWWFHLLTLMWMCEFILACQQMVIAGAVAAWYFCRDRSKLHCPVGMSFYRLILYHLGSVALGSLTIVIFRIPRLILLWVEAKLKKYPGSQCAILCLKCCQCCLWCLGKFIRYLNHNAYTVIAIEGVGFCKAAQVAFTTLVTNALRVATINSVGDFILFLAKCAVTALTVLAGILLMKLNTQLHFTAVPVFAGGLVAFFIAHCVLSVYEMVIDTLFLCFCEDFNKNDGTPGSEYYAPKSLMKHLTTRTNGDTDEAAAQPLQDLSATPKS